MDRLLQTLDWIDKVENSLRRLDFTEALKSFVRVNKSTFLALNTKITTKFVLYGKDHYGEGSVTEVKLDR